MKKLVSVFLVICILCSIAVCPALAKGQFQAVLVYNGAVHEYSGGYFRLFVDGTQIQADIPPLVLEKDRSIAAVRELFEAVGAEVIWQQTTPPQVEIRMPDTVVNLTIDSVTAYVNGVPTQMEVPARLVAWGNVGKTMVPVRFVAETLGMQVNFDSSTNTISIETPSVSASPSPTATATSVATPTYAPPAPTPVVKRALSLSTTLSDNTTEATILLSEPIDTYDIFTLESPNRVVLDIWGFTAAFDSTAYDAGGNTQQIRTGDYGGAARIVFDVYQIPSYQVSVSDDRKSVTVTLTAQEPLEPSGGPIVVIDAGHGGTEPGAIGYDGSGNAVLVEKDVTLPIAMEVVRILQQAGVDVRTTRTTDTYVSLADRADFANQIGASLFVSVHCNAFTTTDVNGSLVMHHTSKDTSAYGVSGQQLAENILNYLPASLETRNAGRLNGSAMYVIRNVDMPSVIVETAFITNESDRAKLADPVYQQKAAQAIAQGILDTIPMLTK